MKTYEQVRQILSMIEPTEEMYAQLDRDDLPHLQRLMQEPQPWRAARAINAASRLGTTAAQELVRSSAADPRREVRSAVATVAPKLPPALTSEVLEHLIDDSDLSVRKLAVKSVGPQISDTLKGKLRLLVDHGTDERIKALAGQKLELVR